MPAHFCFLNPEEVDETTLTLRGERYHHLVRVRRVRVGEWLRAALPDGRVLRAQVREISPEALLATVEGEECVSGVSPCHITLYQAVLKGEKMEVVVQKASELGVQTLVPVLARRSIPRWTPAQARERAERWQRIAEAAAEQCECCVPLQVLPPQALAAALAGATQPLLLLHERAGQSLRAFADAHPQLPALGLCIGPEGGWEDEEVQALQAVGAVAIHLGGRILRAETASIATATLAQYLWGDLGLSPEV